MHGRSRCRDGHAGEPLCPDVRSGPSRPLRDAIHVPTLLLCRPDYADISSDEVDYVRQLIPGARLEPVGGVDEQPYFGDPTELVAHVTKFVDVIRSEEADLDRVLSTVMFTDIVASTSKAAELGDTRWADLLQRHHATIRAMLARYRGTEVDTTGDGFFATFDGPARGVRCAEAIVEAVRRLGLDVRIGVHTGEVQTLDGKVGGLAVVVGARVGAIADPGEILATSTVKDLTAGSGLTFVNRGEHELKACRSGGVCSASRATGPLDHIETREPVRLARSPARTCRGRDVIGGS
jgi:class 3 adenylate cyclase